MIREALARLKFEGLIESRQGLGAVVIGDQSSKLFRLDSWDKDNLSDWDYLFELRSIIEGEAAVLAAKRAGKDDLERLKNKLDELSEAAIKKVDGRLSDLQFHRAVAHASKNPFLEGLLNFIIDTVLKEILNFWENRSQRPDIHQSVYHEHQLIYRAIKEGKPQLARKAVLDHLGKSIDYLRQLKHTGQEGHEREN